MYVAQQNDKLVEFHCNAADSLGFVQDGAMSQLRIAETYAKEAARVGTMVNGNNQDMTE